MFMTEDEAKTKCCCGPEGTGTPMVVTASTQGISPAIHAVAGYPRYCCGSLCMAWREGGSEYEHATLYDLVGIAQGPFIANDERAIKGLSREKIAEATKGWEPYGKRGNMLAGIPVAYRKLKVRRGFCGLARRPSDD